MSLQAFGDSILSPDLRAVAAHWREARGTRRMPSWSDLRPSAIAKQLPLLWAYVYDPALEDFVGRLAGETITRIFGRSLKGMPMSELQPALDYPRLFARAKRVMTEPALFRGHGLVFKHLEKYGHGERIIMPLASDGAHGDAVIGATVYREEGIVLSDLEKIEEVEDWFHLA
jgi:hypothetical protein